MNPLYTQTLIRTINLARIRNLLRCGRDQSRSDLARASGLDKKTLTHLAGELLEEGWIEEGGGKNEGRGRPGVQLRLNPDRVVIGIDIQPDAITGILMNAYGTILEERIIRLSVPLKPETLKTEVEALALQLGAGHSLLGTGVVIPAVLESADGQILVASNLPELSGLTLRRLLTGIPGPLFFENSSKSCALAEEWFGAGRTLNDFVTLDLGWGVGAGFIIDRRLYKGAGQLAGEIGHVCIEPGGRPCACGSRGCLETYLGAVSLRKELGGRDLSPETLLPLTNADEGLLIQAGERLGMGIAAIINLLSPCAIILSGEICQYQEILLPALRRILQERCIGAHRERVSIEISTLRQSAALGAGSLALAPFFEVAGVYTI